jgi:hypothetical protein
MASDAFIHEGFNVIKTPRRSLPVGEKQNQPFRLSQDPAFRLIGSEKIWDRGAALTSRLQSGRRLPAGPGNVHSAGDWEELLLPEIERQQKTSRWSGTRVFSARRRVGRQRGAW